MRFDLEKLKTTDWVEYGLYFVSAWFVFPYILFKSMRFGFLIADGTVGHFVDFGSTIHMIIAAKASFLCLMLFLAGIRCVTHKLITLTARRWHRVHYTV